MYTLWKLVNISMNKFSNYNNNNKQFVWRWIEIFPFELHSMSKWISSDFANQFEFQLIISIELMFFIHLWKCLCTDDNESMELSAWNVNRWWKTKQNWKKMQLLEVHLISYTRESIFLMKLSDRKKKQKVHWSHGQNVIINIKSSVCNWLHYSWKRIAITVLISCIYYLWAYFVCVSLIFQQSLPLSLSILCAKNAKRVQFDASSLSLLPLSLIK